MKSPTFPRFFKHLTATSLATAVLSTCGLQARQIPINDNATQPYVGVTESNIYTKAVPEFYKWLNRGPKQYAGVTLEYNAGSWWEGIAGKSPWFYGPNASWVAGDPENRSLIICTPMFPGPPDRSGAATGKSAGPVSFAAGANGDYDWAFKGLAEQLVAHKLGNSVLRLAWEFNGTWYAWKLDDVEDVPNFVAYWKRIVNVMRSVPGADNLKFMWSGSIACGTPYKIADAFPEGNDVTGKPFVDMVGADVYDKCWNPDTYPYPKGASAAEKLARQKAAWQFYLTKEYNNIGAWQEIAEKYKLPFCIPEWGLFAESGNGGGDNPYFIEQMFEYIQNSENNIWIAMYYDAEIESKISNVGPLKTPFPKASAMMLKLYGLPKKADSPFKSK